MKPLLLAVTEEAARTIGSLCQVVVGGLTDKAVPVCGTCSHMTLLSLDDPKFAPEDVPGHALCGPGNIYVRLCGKTGQFICREMPCQLTAEQRAELVVEAIALWADKATEGDADGTDATAGG